MYRTIIHAYSRHNLAISNVIAHVTGSLPAPTCVCYDDNVMIIICVRWICVRMKGVRPNNILAVEIAILNTCINI